MIEKSGDRPQRTSLTLLQGMLAGDECQWHRFYELFGPLVYEWCRRAGVQQSDSADIVQEVFRAVVISLKDFRRNQPGDSFHGWLWGITRHKTLDYYRSEAGRPVGKGGSSAQSQVNQIPDDLPLSWTDDQQQKDTDLMFIRALEIMKSEFEPRTWQAFWKTVVEESRPADVAAALGMTVGAVYNARYKVLRRLRNEFEGMVELPDLPRKML